MDRTADDDAAGRDAGAQGPGTIRPSGPGRPSPYQALAAVRAFATGSGSGPAPGMSRPTAPVHAARIQQRARREVLYFDAPPYWSVDNTVQLDRLSDGVSYRTVYGEQAIEYPGAMTRIDQCLAAGEQARVTARLPMKMMIIDRETAFTCAFGENDPAGSPGGLVIVDSGPLLDGLVELFERVWADSAPFDHGTPEPRAEHDELDAAEKRLLTLLLGGLTDDAIARHLGVGRRTVLRRARGLMDRAGVATRMQLGWYAARRGWVDVSCGTPDPGAARG
ncbi:hypothetical protein ABT097_01065 [Streptomyces sp. NPDC002225]|uniref:hypothetical protein n=1 Tax=Streptomyces sp. NPDC002225 TaxID=3154413 RepID=UPI003320E529